MKEYVNYMFNKQGELQLKYLTWGISPVVNQL